MLSVFRGDVLSGIEIVVASRHADRLIGTNDRNALHGGDGDDLLTDDGGHDRLTGGAGLDRIEGGGANTASYATALTRVTVDLSSGRGTAGDAAGDRLEGIERILGSAYDDVLAGDAGANTLTGNNGNDALRGNAGADVLSGGGHGDRFVYAAASDSTVAAAGRDTIVDFWSGEGDKIDLRLIEADGKAANGDTAFAFGTGGFTGAGAELRVVQTATIRVFQVLADIDGNRIPDLAILVSIVQDLGTAEFLL